MCLLHCDSLESAGEVARDDVTVRFRALREDEVWTYGSCGLEFWHETRNSCVHPPVSGGITESRCLAIRSLAHGFSGLITSWHIRRVCRFTGTAMPLVWPTEEFPVDVTVPWHLWTTNGWLGLTVVWGCDRNGCGGECLRRPCELQTGEEPVR